jgi:hypothetical protein
MGHREQGDQMTKFQPYSYLLCGITQMGILHAVQDWKKY